VAHRHRSFGFDYDVRSKGITCLHWILRAVKEALAIGVLATMGLLILYLAVQRLQRDYQETRSSRNETQRDQ
jgi:hypothetical protein